MSRRRDEDPVRWTDAPSEDALERRAGELLKLPPPAPLGPVRRARIAMRLAAGAGPCAVDPAALRAAGRRRGARRRGRAWLRRSARVASVAVTVTAQCSAMSLARGRTFARRAIRLPVPAEEPAAAPAPPSPSRHRWSPAPPAEAAPRVHHPRTNVGGAAARRDS